MGEMTLESLVDYAKAWEKITRDDSSEVAQGFGFVAKAAESAIADRDALKAEVERLRAFAWDLLGEHPELGSWDGCDLQELAVKHALMRQKNPAPSEPCGEGCKCAGFYSEEDFKDGSVECYVLTIQRPSVDTEGGE